MSTPRQPRGNRIEIPETVLPPVEPVPVLDRPPAQTFREKDADIFDFSEPRVRNSAREREEPAPFVPPQPREQARAIDVANAYWIVGGDETRVWSSARSAYVSPDDEAAQAFVVEHKRFLRSPDDATLSAYLTKIGLKPSTVSEDAVIAERERRLAMGFDYDFADERGVHRIGTTEQDMKGWDEVTKLANARIARRKATPLMIVTDTGPVQVTPEEWQDMLLFAAEQFRQPIWFASFSLQSMNPIPADYADDKYWPTQK